MKSLGLASVAVLAFALVPVASAESPSPGPSQPRRLVRDLDRLQARGDLDGALRVAERARATYPATFEIHARYQDIRRALGDAVAVREEYGRRRRREKTADNICLYARMLKGAPAIREFKNALRRDKEHFWAHYGIGVAYLRAGDTKRARLHLETAQHRDFHHPAPKIRLGELHERAGRVEKALSCYEMAAVDAPDLPDPVFHQVFVLLELGRHADAQRAAARIVRMRSPDASTLGAIAHGVVCSARGDQDAAVRHFETAVRRTTTHGVHALTMLGDTLTDLKRYDEAAESYTRALGLHADNPRALMGLGYLYYRRGLLKQADKVFARAEKAGDGSRAAEAAFFRGVVAEERDRLTRAMQHYRRAAKADPSSADYVLALAALYERLDRPAQALTAYKTAAKLDETDALSLFQCGLIEADRENGPEALKHLEAAITRDPKLLDAYLTAGTVCQDLLRSRKKALSWYKRYLAEGGQDERVYEWVEELRK